MNRNLLVSLFTSLFVGLASFLLLSYAGVSGALYLSLISAVLFSLLLLLCLTVTARIQEKKYRSLEAKITSPIFYQTNGNFDLGGGTVKNGNIYFCEAGVVCACMDQKPYALDGFPVEALHRIAFDSIHLHFYLKDGRILRITLPDAYPVIDLLRQKNWVT